MKEKILNELMGNNGRYISGESLSETLGVSRTAIWKNINELREAGYVIESSSKKGYLLTSIPDILNEAELKRGLDTKTIGKRIDYFKTIDSTNRYAKEIAAKGCADGTVVVADTQTAGRGRLGRAWSSADKKGIWMSIVLRPTIPPEDVQLVTLAASVAVASAVQDVAGVQAGIKWPNDIILDGKKVCGILTEMSCEMEQVNFLIVGIGINVSHQAEDFPEELRSTATSLKLHREQADKGAAAVKRSELIKQIFIELEKMYEYIMQGQNKAVIKAWKDYSVTLGRQVRVMLRGCEYVGTAADITEEGKLVLTLEDGTTQEVVSGEVSVRGLLGYV